MEVLYFVISILIYFIPSLIAYKRSDMMRIFLLNLLLGWTLIGWIVALIWAVGKEKTSVAVKSVKTSASDELTALLNLKEKGAITEDEFQVQKKKILSDVI